MQQLDNIINNLERQALQFDVDNRKKQRQFNEQWFTPSLFMSRSNQAIDYVNEVKALVAKLPTATRPEVNDFIASQISQQLLALTTVLRGCSLPVEKQDFRLVRQSQLAKLHQQLVTYRGYESRLQQNIQACREQNDSIGAQQQEKRLNRCQQAISALEADIQRLEEGR